jgi:hypothetical protein
VSDGQPPTTRAAYRILEDDDGVQRVSAVNDRGEVIVGAFRPSGKNYWQLYITPSVAHTAGIPFKPGHVALWTRDQAHHWVDLLSRLYCRAIEVSGCA